MKILIYLMHTQLAVLKEISSLNSAKCVDVFLGKREHLENEFLSRLSSVKEE